MREVYRKKSYTYRCKPIAAWVGYPWVARELTTVKVVVR